MRDVKGVLIQLTSEFVGEISYSMTLSGINSAHPLLKELLQDALGITVSCLNPVLVPGVVGIALMISWFRLVLLG